MLIEATTEVFIEATKEAFTRRREATKEMFSRRRRRCSRDEEGVHHLMREDRVVEDTGFR